MGECMNYQTEELTRELASLGYALGEYENNAEQLKPATLIEELIIKILTKNPDPRYILGIPVIIAKNNVDYEKLLSLAEQNHALRRVGYLLDITQNVSNNRIYLPNIETAIYKAYDSLKIEMPEESLSDFSERSKSIYRELALEKDERGIAVKWKVFTLTSLENITKKFELYNDLPSKSKMDKLSFMRSKYSTRCGNGKEVQ